MVFTMSGGGHVGDPCKAINKIEISQMLDHNVRLVHVIELWERLCFNDIIYFILITSQLTNSLHTLNIEKFKI